MPRPSPLACTTAIPATPPQTQHATQPPPTAKRRGNPNLALIPRCGALTRAGCPCRAPSIHGKPRCRMHGGRSTGPRTAEGRARIAVARTTHGGYGADTRAFNRHHFTFLRRSRLRLDAVLHCDGLPPDLAARMAPIAPELSLPPRPTRGITRAEDRALLRAETEALAPWKQALALARKARHPDRATRAAPSGTPAPAQATPLAPEPAADTALPVSPAVPPAAWAAPHAPIPPAPTQAAPHQAPESTGAQVLAEPHAPNRAARRASNASAPARSAALPIPHAPEPPTDAPATCSASPPTASAPAQTEPLAPIPPPPARAAPDQAPASLCTAQAATPHAPKHPGRGASSAPAPARLPALPRPHAPNRIPTPHTGSRTLPVGRAARRWLREQKHMHRT